MTKKIDEELINQLLPRYQMTCIRCEIIWIKFSECKPHNGEIIVFYRCAQDFVVIAEFNNVDMYPNGSASKDWVSIGVCGDDNLEIDSVNDLWVPLPEKPN